MGFTLLELLLTLTVLAALMIFGGVQLPELVRASALRGSSSSLHSPLTPRPPGRPPREAAEEEAIEGAHEHGARRVQSRAEP